MLRLPILALLILALVLSPAPVTHALVPDTPAACNTIPELQGVGNSTPCEGHRDNIQGRITGVTATGLSLPHLVGYAAAGVTVRVRTGPDAWRTRRATCYGPPRTSGTTTETRRSCETQEDDEQQVLSCGVPVVVCNTQVVQGVL